jgi:hypothetical protein
MISDAMLDTQTLIKIGSGIRKIMGNGGGGGADTQTHTYTDTETRDKQIHRPTDSMVVTWTYFYFLKIRKVG